MRISRLVRHVFGFGAYSRTPSPDQTAEYGRFRRDLGCGKAENLGAGEQKRSGGGLRGGQGAAIAQNYKQTAISLQ